MAIAKKIERRRFMMSDSTWHRKIASLLCFLGLMVFCALPSAYAKPDFPRLVIEIQLKDGKAIPFETEVAHLPKLRQHGLMGRTTLTEQQAMLFVWPVTARRVFWMKNTPLSLDILFFDNTNRLVHLHQNTTPMSEALLSSLVPIAYAVEVRAGVSRQLGIGLGAVLKLPADLPNPQ